jgi:hypothetical protein
VLFTPVTDSAAMYASRVIEQRAERGPYGREPAARHFAQHLEWIGTDHMRELTYPDRKALHNFKYVTWVEQQQRGMDELGRLWDPDLWARTFGRVDEWDAQIKLLNDRTGVQDQL